jgi:hypothetical protein
MSNLLSQASLVMIPSGYKEDIVYSQIPTSGAGDLSFTRASNGTRINSAGLVEVCPWNLLEQSETFATSPWSKSAGTTLTSGQTDPNGGSSAFRMQMSSASNFLASGIFTVVSGSIYIYTIYIKSNTGSNQSFRIIDGVRGVAGGVLTGTATTQWQRFEVQITPNSTSGAFQLDNAGGAYSNDLLIAFSQTNLGTAKPYFPTTDRLNVPRLTYQNGGGGCPSLLLEKQSTNYVKYSEDFTQSDWQKSGATITANSIISPDGTQNATRVQFSAGSRYVYQTISGVPAGSVTISCYIKGASVQNIGFSDGNANPNQITLTTEWQRYTFTFTYSSGGIGIQFDNYFGVMPNQESKDFYIWGAQLEQSSYATSLINTTSASATRVADFATTNNISSLFGSTEGSFFIEMTYDNTNASGAIPLFLRSSTNAAYNYATYLQFGGGTVQFYVYDSGSSQVSMTSSAIYTTGQKLKIAFAYKQNDFVIYVNGVQIGTDANGTISTSLAFIDLGTYNQVADTYRYNGAIGEAVLFPTRLTNTQLSQLTA